MALLPSDPAQQKRLLIALVPLLLVFAYWYFIDGKKQAEVTALEQRLEQLETTNATARVQAQQGGPELEKKLAAYEQHMVRLEQLIPQNEEVPELLHSITIRSREAGVELLGIRPEAPTPGSFYTRQTYAMGVIGAYHDVGKFLSYIGSLPRIITPTGLRLTPAATAPTQGRGQGPRTQRLEASFRIETYVIPPAGAGAAPGAGAAANDSTE